MKRAASVGALIAAISLVAASVAAGGGPGTKQNGSNPLFKDFTSICSVPGYLDYGHCNGDPTTFTNITGRINAVQAKTGRWNLGFTFTGLQPGLVYQLWGNQLGVTPAPFNPGFFSIGTGTAGLDGTLRFSYQTTDPSNLGFDLNIFEGNVTVVTSYWSQQWIQVLNPDGTLYVPHP
ncbi:MAG TPA: hypothetical protein VGF23_04275 [Gaiellaceae bacterium]|jgi:hypothetical protein